MLRSRGLNLMTLLALAPLGWASLSPHRLELRDFPTPPDHQVSRTDTTVYEVNFIEGFDSWSSQDLTDQGSSWHMSSFNSFDGSWNWWSGNVDVGGYLDHTLLFLELPPLNLSATTNPQLTFNLFWALEDPSTALPPYTGWDACHVEVKMGAGAWQILPPTTPAYNISNSFAFAQTFGHNVTAGWGGLSNTWRNAVCNLTAYRSTATRIRFAFASDDGTSFPDDPALTGMQLDNIVIADGALVLLQNNADGLDVPGPTLHYSGVPAAGDHWSISNQFHSPPISLRCSISDQDVPMSNSVTSPALLLPPNYHLTIDFWTRVDMPDFDGDGNQALDDYFLLEYSTNGAIWTTLFVDYYDTETGSGAWYHFINGGGHGRSTDISFLAGQLAFFRFRVQTDNNHDGGTGTGFYLDDFRIVGEAQLTHDVGVVELRLPYPRTQGRPIEARTSLQNFGTAAANAVQWSLYMDNSPAGPGGTVSLGQNQRLDIPFTLTPDNASLHFPDVRLLTADDYAVNDRMRALSYIVRPTGVLELASDYSWDVTNPDFLHTTSAGESIGLGYAQIFQPPTMGQNMGYALDSLRIRLASYNVGPEESTDWRLRIWSGQPVNGTLLHESEHSYTPSYAGGDASEDWIPISLAGILEPFTEAFWVEVQTLELNDFQTPGNPRPVPNVTIVPRSWEPVASYRVVGTNLFPLSGYQFNYHVFGHEQLIDGIGDQPAQPARASLNGVWPNPFNPSTTIAFNLDRPADVTLSVHDLQGRLVTRLTEGPRAAGEHQVLLHGEGWASGLYLVSLSVDGQPAGTQKVMLLK